MGGRRQTLGVDPVSVPGNQTGAVDNLALPESDLRLICCQGQAARQPDAPLCGRIQRQQDATGAVRKATATPQPLEQPRGLDRRHTTHRVCTNGPLRPTADRGTPGAVHEVGRRG